MKRLALFLIAFLAPAISLADAYTFVAAGTRSSQTGTLSPGQPAGKSTGDLLLLATAARIDTEAATAPTGYTLLCDTTSTSNDSLALYARIATNDASDNVSADIWNGSSQSFAQIAAFTGNVYTPLSTIVDTCTVQGSNGSLANLPSPALTISTNNRLVICLGKKTKTTTSDGLTISSTPTGCDNLIGFAAQSATQVWNVWDYTQQTTANSVSSSSWVQSVAESNSYATIMITLKAAVAVTPTFTSAPAIGTRTTSSIPINFTSDTTGTVYGARLTDGSGTPTCDQLEAQTATGGVQYWSEAVVATVADSHTFSSITDGTLTDGYFCIEDGSNNDSAVASIANMYKLPAFTTALSIASQTSTVYTTNSKILDGPGTVDLVACKKDSSPPSVSQVEAHTGGCIVNFATDDATGTMALTITGTVLPIYDLYNVGSYGGQHEAAVHALVDEALDPPSGKQDITLSSISSTSWCIDFNAVATPDIAVPDIIRIDSATAPTGFPWTQGVDCNGSYPGDTSRQSLLYDIYDDSAQGYMSGGPGTLWFNDQAAACPFSRQTFGPYKIGLAITAIDLAALCPDPEGDAQTCAVTSGTLSTGLVLGGTGNCTLSGIPTVENEDGNDVTFGVTDVPGLVGSLLSTTITLDTVTVPDCQTTHVSVENCIELLGTANLAIGTVTVVNAPSIPTGGVVSQTPAGSTEAEPFSTVNVSISAGNTGIGGSHIGGSDIGGGEIGGSDIKRPQP